MTGRFRSAALLGAVALGCRQPIERQPLAAEQEQFWSALASLCGRAFQGRLTEGSPADSGFRSVQLTMHVRGCSPTEIRVPFHAGTDRSRTWVVTRIPAGLRLKHDHRHADGSEDRVTQYGGDTRSRGEATRQEFYADSLTTALIPAARTNVWTMEVVPGERFAYALRREGTDRRFRVEFDLTRTAPVPPAPWGNDDEAGAERLAGRLDSLRIAARMPGQAVVMLREAAIERSPFATALLAAFPRR